MRKLIKRLFVAPLFLIAFLLVVVEDEIWHKAIQLNEKYLKNNKYLLQLEVSAKNWSVWQCFSLFLVPLILLFPIKLAAMFMISNGHVIVGTVLFISIKFTGAALSAKIYAMTESKLRTLIWFSKFVDYVSSLRKTMANWVVSSKAYASIKEWKEKVKNHVKAYKTKTKSKIYRLISKFKYLVKKK